MPDPIYLDHAATTQLRPEARQAMEPYLASEFGNPSSIYRLAREARAALDRARDSVASCIGAEPAELVFTSGGTEGNNAAIKGAALARQSQGRHIVTTAIEHHSVLHPVEELTERFGFEATIVPVDSRGIVDPAEIERAIRPDTTLVSMMWANNEIGTIQPVAEAADLARARGISIHVDAVQAAGPLPIELSLIPVSLLTISAHKLHGPKGAGILYVRRGTPWWPLITGGGQERNRRAGTENVAGIVGMARALELACAEREGTAARVRTLRDELWRQLSGKIEGAHHNGDMQKRLPSNLNVSFDHVHGESLLVALDLAGIMASSGSACTSGSLEPSHVLRAIGRDDALAQSSLRLTLGPENTPEELRRTVETIAQVVGRLRGLAPAIQRA